MNVPSGSGSRRWRLLFGRGPLARRLFYASPRTAEQLRGRCPGCGTVIVFHATSSPLARCGHCETPLVAGCGELDIEQAVYARLYDGALASAGMQQIIVAADG